MENALLEIEPSEPAMVGHHRESEIALAQIFVNDMSHAR
jgi:hypothetical protein